MTAPPKPSLGANRLAVSALFFMNGYLFATWVSRIPALQSQHHLSHGQMGLALLALALGAAGAMPPTGWLIGRVGSQTLCRWSAAAFCLLVPAVAFASSRPALMAALVGFGIAHGSMDIAMNAQAVAVERRYARSIMSSFHALFSAGGLCGAASGGVAASFHLAPPPHFSLVGAGLLGVGFVACARLLGEETQPVPLTPPLTSGVERVVPNALSGAGLGQTSSALGTTRSTLLILSVVALCSMMGEGAMGDWSALYLRDVRHAGDGWAAAGYAAYSLAMASVRWGGDRLADRLGRERLIRAGGLLAAAGLSAALLIPGILVPLVGFACVGAGFATIVPMVFSAAGNLPGVAPGTALAYVTTIGYAGFIAGPPLIGFAAELIGLRGALGLIVVTSLVIAALRTAGLKGNPRTAYASSPA